MSPPNPVYVPTLLTIRCIDKETALRYCSSCTALVEVGLSTYFVVAQRNHREAQQKVLGQDSCQELAQDLFRTCQELPQDLPKALPKALPKMPRLCRPISGHDLAKTLPKILTKMIQDMMAIFLANMWHISNFQRYTCTTWK